MTNNNSLHRVNYDSEKETMSLAEIIDRFLDGFSRLWWVALILTLVFGAMGFYRYNKSYVPMYQSEATFSITTPERNGISSVYSGNNELASELSVSFNYIINNEVFYEIIKSDLGIDYIPCTITVSAVEETNILTVKTIGMDADMNLKVINSVLNNYSSVTEFVLGDTKLTVLEEPTKSQEPINAYEPVKPALKFGAIGFILGLIPSILYAMLVKTIKSKEEVEELLSVSCMGALPAVMLNNKDKKLNNCSILNEKVGFRYLEAIRSVSSKCEKEMEKSKCKVVIVTSTVEGEGKSTFAMNLAYSLSKSQKKVMLIDGDLRKPTLRKITDAVGPNYSMEDFLDRKIKSSEAIVNIEGTRVLMLAPDKTAKNPIECLNSSAMSQFIEEGKEVVDYIIIDAPACRGVSDAAVLAKYSDGVIYVVKEDSTKVNRILDSIQEFSYTRVPIIGCVLNGTNKALKLSYGYGYANGYGKYGKYSRYSYGRYGYGRYGYGNYGYGNYGVYGELSEKEFRKKERKISKTIALTTTDEQKKALEEERIRIKNEEKK